MRRDLSDEVNEFNFYSIKSNIEIVECQPIFCTLIELVKIGDLATSKHLLSNETINNKEDLYLVCSEEAITSNQKDMFIFYVHKRVSLFERQRRFRKHIDSLDHFFDKMASELIERGKASWLKFLRVALGQHLSRRNPENLEKQLQIAVSNNQRSCFDLLLNECNGIFGKDTYGIILRSGFCDKLKILKDIISSVLFYHSKVISKIVYLCLKANTCLDDIKSIIPFDRLSNETVQSLCCIAISLNRFDFFKYCIIEKKCDLSDDLIHNTLNLSSELQFFDRFPRRYKKYFERKLILKKDTLGLEELKILTNPPILLSLMKTKEFDDWQYLKNIIFKYLFVREGIILDSKVSWERKRQSLEIFCILIHYSENKQGLQQQDVDSAINSIIQASNNSYRRSFVKYCARLIATLYRYGYGLHEIANSFVYRYYFLIEDAHQLLFKTVLAGCSQKNYNLLMESHTTCFTVMPLWKMCRIVVRNAIRKPYTKNLNHMMKMENLPFFIEKLMNFEKEMESIDIQIIDFSIINDIVHIYNL
ncbi:DgyrCDS5890 [Dimorphilus gyrociliatus]|uniref:DgyrCDS5890 n=1 Tax=Dimorphilus gyrociliatus TaxID=2664684 RepID=A0A7I8VMX2_9ANNE|nr:DgyrCDS5890 [Dimorphilus gyrociliatus]